MAGDIVIGHNCCVNECKNSFHGMKSALIVAQITFKGGVTRRWEDNIKMDLQEVGGGCEDWMELTQDRDRWQALVGTVMNLRVPKIS